MMKKICFLSVLAMVLCLAACTGPESPGVPTTEPSQPSQPSVHSHSFGSWESVQTGNCETDTIRRRVCACGEEQIRTDKAPGHKWTKADCENPALCRICDAVGEPALGHDLTDGYCNRCETSFRTAEDVQKYIKIVNASVYQIDSAGGVSVDIGWENMHSETVNYIKFKVCALNAVGDPVRCEVRREYNFTLTQTGPVLPGARSYTIADSGWYGKGSYIWNNVWYNDTAKTIRILDIIIAYADGSEIRFTEQDAQLAFGPMTLSKTATKIQMEMPQLTGYGTTSDLKLKFGIVSDEGYLIAKHATAKVKLTLVESDPAGGLFSWIDKAVLYNKSLSVNEDCLITAYSNEITLPLSVSGLKKGTNMVRFDLTLQFSDGNPPLSYSVVGYIRVV